MRVVIAGSSRLIGSAPGAGVLVSRRVLPAVLHGHGYTFGHARVSEALGPVVGS